MTPCPGAATLQASIDTTRPARRRRAPCRARHGHGGNVSRAAVDRLRRQQRAVDGATPDSSRRVGLACAQRLRDRARRRRRPARLRRRRRRWYVCRLDGTNCRSTSARYGNPDERPGSGCRARGVEGAGVRRATPCATVRSSGWSRAAALRRHGVPGAAKIDAARRVGQRRRGLERRRSASRTTRRAGPSGISGYAVTQGDAAPGTDGDRARRPGARRARDRCPRGRRACAPARSAAPASPSAQVGEGLVRIDRTPPVVAAQHRRRPARRAGGRVAAPGRAPRPSAPSTRKSLSGMAPAAEGEPVTRGGHLEYQVDDDPVVRVRGASETIDLPRDGLHVVTVRAVDVAGNVSSPQRASFRVDRNRPGRHDRRDRPAPPRAGSTPSSPRSASTAPRSSCSPGEHASGRRSACSSSSARSRPSCPTTTSPPGTTRRGSASATARATRASSPTPGPTGTGALRLPLRETIVIDGGLAAGTAQGVDHVTVVSGTAVLVRGPRDHQRRAAGERSPGRGAGAHRRWRLARSRGARERRRGQGLGGAADGPEPAHQARRRGQRAGDRRRQPDARRSRCRRASRCSVNRRSLRNGEAARFSGKLLGGFVPRRGRELELQGYNPLQGALAAGAHAGPANDADRALAHGLPVHLDDRGDRDLPLPCARGAAAGPSVRRGVQPRGDRHRARLNPAPTPRNDESPPDGGLS